LGPRAHPYPREKWIFERFKDKKQSSEYLKDGIFVRFEVFTAVTVKNAVSCDIKTQFVLHRKHITSPLQSPAG
jgi:hypothetical protein